MWKGVHLHRQWVRCGGSSETLTPSICVYPALGHNNIDNKCTNTTVQKYKYKQRSYETLTLLFVFIRWDTTRSMANEQIHIQQRKSKQIHIQKQKSSNTFPSLYIFPPGHKNINDLRILLPQLKKATLVDLIIIP